MSVEAGRFETVLPQIALDVYVTVTTMEQDGILSQVRRLQSKPRRLESLVVMLHIVQRWYYFCDLPLTINDLAQGEESQRFIQELIIEILKIIANYRKEVKTTWGVSVYLQRKYFVYLGVFFILGT